MAEISVVGLAQRLRRGPLGRFNSIWSILRHSYNRSLAVHRAVITVWRRAAYKAVPGPANQVHLSWVDDPSTSFTVSWHTPGIGGAPSVAYRELGTTDWRHTAATSARSPGVGGRLHRATVTGLRPETVYEYSPSSDPGFNTRAAILRARTAPSPGGSDFSFAFFCDTGLIGRKDGRAAAVQQVIDEIVRDDPLLVLGGGDYAYANRDSRYPARGDAVDAWFKQMEPLLSRVPIMAQYGNHEVMLDERFEDWAPRFAHPAGPQECRSYSFDVGDIHFTAFYAPWGTPPEAAQLAWLDADLAAARRRGVRWLVVFQHVPIYSHGHSHPASLRMRAAVAPILLKYRVDLHLSGHDQNYERSLPVTGDPDAPTIANRSPDTYRAGEGTVYAKISPGGKISDMRNDFSRFTTAQQDFIAVRDDTAHHYALVRVHARGELVFEAYSIGGNGAPKRVLDKFRIIAA